MRVEYKGVADRWAGSGVVHEVRAWWNIREHSEGQVKRAAINCLRTEGRVLDHAEVIGMDMSTYGTPNMNGMVRIRVLTVAEREAQKELKARHYTVCEVCGDKSPGEVVEIKATGVQQAMCFTCRTGLESGSYQVKHWIKADGTVQIN